LRSTLLRYKVRWWDTSKPRHRRLASQEST